MERHKTPEEICSERPPSEAWLFAQAILGRPIPRIQTPEAVARQKRSELERLAPFSSEHAKELLHLQTTEAETSRKRELLEWTAQFSSRAEDELRAIKRKEAEHRDAW